VRFLFKGKYLKQSYVFAFDITISLFSIVLAYFLRFNFYLPEEYRSPLIYFLMYVLIVRMVTFLIFKTYTGIIRYTTIKDVERIIRTVSSGTMVFVLVNFGYRYFTGNEYPIPTGVLIIDFFVTFFIMTSSRLLVKNIYMEIKSPSGFRNNVVLFGAGNLGNITKQTIEQEIGLRYKVVAFVEDNPDVIGKSLENVKIYSCNRLEKILKEYNVSRFIFTKKMVDERLKCEIVDVCLKYNVQVLTIPPVDDWVNGALSMKQLRRFKIDDLLQRPSIRIENTKREEEYRDKVILITGAAGSIGSEIVRQLIPYRPRKILIVDQAESPLYYLDLSMREKYGYNEYLSILGDISDKNRMEEIFRKHSVQVIFHAAAYKHVPVLENMPSEAIRVNVKGTRVLADLAIRYDVEKFIMISTDKAVRPTNVMGASKRIAEIYIQGMNNLGRTKFITTRFGNVLGSNGSVIPRFREQLEKDKVITITHPEVTRYFMTIPEAVELVLEAGAMGNGGEIFIFDMGNPVRIVDLAEKMIRLSGYEPGRDVKIRFTGLRPGEKLYEELLNDLENTLPTYHPKIMIAKVMNSDPVRVRKDVQELLDIAGKKDMFAIVKKMKRVVPDFKSKNSIFEKLDQKSVVRKKVFRQRTGTGLQ